MNIQSNFHLRKNKNFLYRLLFLQIIFQASNFPNHSDHSRVVFSNAVSYNEYIISRQKELMEDVDMFYLSSEHDYPLTGKMIDTLSLHASNSISDLQVLAPYKNDSSFRETAIDVFNFYNTVFVPYARKMIYIKMKIDSGTASDSDYDNYNDYVRKIKQRSTPIESRLVEIQARFAKKNNFTLSSNKKTEE